MPRGGGGVVKGRGGGAGAQPRGGQRTVMGQCFFLSQCLGTSFCNGDLDSKRIFSVFFYFYFRDGI